MNKDVLVIGGGLSGIQAALDIANCGFEVTLIEQSPSLQIESGKESTFLRPKFLEAANHPHIKILTSVEVKQVEGKKGSLHIKALEYPRYVKTELCTSCGRCELACPVKLQSKEGNDARKAIRRPEDGWKSIPSTCMIEKKGVPPCNAACPAGVNVQGYVALISQGKLKEALALVREAVPFPHILGRVCTHPCESACTRGKIDQPIGIASLKRYIADMEPAQYSFFPSEAAPSSEYGRVAIIGAGPAGLTCARDLLRLGHASTIFEALPVAGGMIAVGMPRFRLPREVREAEISALIRQGIEIKTSTPLGKDLTLSNIRKQGYKAIFVATGAHKNAVMNIPGEDLEGVIDSIVFLRAINLKQPVDIGHSVVIIGGGYTAMDSARTAIRLHCNKVRVLYRRTEDEMSATRAEILETREEGVEITELVAPVRIIGENGRVVGIECQRMERGDFDETGRRRPVPVEGSEFIIEADTIIPAIGQVIDLEVFSHDPEIHLENDGRNLIVDPLTLSTNVSGIFAGGDVVSGPESMVEAVAAGRRAAVSIDRYLCGEDIRAERTLEKPEPVKVDLNRVKIPPGDRRRIPVLPIRKRVKNFEEVETGYTPAIALRESRRCLNCGGCSECMECVRTCELGAVDHGMQSKETEIEAGVVLFATSPEGLVKPELLAESDESGVHVLRKYGTVPQKLAQASAIASRVVTDLADRHPAFKTSEIAFSGRAPLADDSLAEFIRPKIGVFICRCGGNISNVIDISTLIHDLYGRGGVAHAHEIGYACSDEGALEIREVAKQNHLTHVVLAACACCNIDQICFSCSDRRLACKGKLLGPSQADGLSYEFVNIREHCAWVHSQAPETAQEKATALIWGGVARARFGQPLQTRVQEVRMSAVVIGGGYSGLRAAADLSAHGFSTTLICSAQPLDDDAAVRLQTEIERNDGRILKDAQIVDLQGSVGDYHLAVTCQGKQLSLNTGALVVDISATRSMSLPESLESAIRFADDEFDQTSRGTPGIFVCGTGSARTYVYGALLQGSAAASKASVLLRRGHFKLIQTAAIVNPDVCRGCGTCVNICQFHAPSLVELLPGVFVSRIDQAICRGCGTCVAHCPSNAITQCGLSDAQITAALEAMLISD